MGKENSGSRLNFREGFGRVARATAVLYWVVVLAGTAALWFNNMRSFYISDYSTRFEWSNTWTATPQAAWGLLWSAVAYVVLLYAFRGLRWVARGFDGAND